MAFNVKDLPDDPVLLKQLLEQSQQKEKDLNLKLQLLQQQLFGAKSEKFSDDETKQGRLFDEAEKFTEEKPAKTKVKAHSRKKRGRKKLPGYLPREEVVHDIDDADKLCACGDTLTNIGEDNHEVLKFIPAELKVVVHRKKKYACKKCEGTYDESKPAVITAQTNQLLKGTIADNSLLAYLITSKYCDGLPLYRLSSIFRRNDVDISRGSMAAWVIKASRKLNLMAELLLAEVKAGQHVGIDETTVQVLKEKGRSAKTKSFMWVLRGGRDGPALWYHYAPSRSADVAIKLLDGFSGTLTTDGYPAYGVVADKLTLKHAVCHAHARRYFYRSHEIEKSETARWFLEQYSRLYYIESLARRLKLTPVTIEKLRQQHARPVVEAMLKRCRQLKPSLGQGKLLEAVGYMLKFEKELQLYLSDGSLPIDNNPVENAIRPFVIGRKNWLFSDTTAGAEASALLYSLMETAKANGHNPQKYLLYLFDNFNHAEKEGRLAELLPMNLPVDRVG